MLKKRFFRYLLSRTRPNREAIRKRAIQKELISESDELNDEDILRLATLPGFSTADNVDQISGRGVGLDIVVNEIENLGGRLNIESVEDVIFERVFLIEADFDAAMAERVAVELLSDPVCQDFYIGKSDVPAGPMPAMQIEVHLKSGVTDPVAESVRSALADMGVAAASVRTARKYVLLGSVSEAEQDTIARRILGLPRRRPILRSGDRGDARVDHRQAGERVGSRSAAGRGAAPAERLEGAIPLPEGRVVFIVVPKPCRIVQFQLPVHDPFTGVP